jgi:hypothetical protein
MASAVKTTDHKTIRKWVEERGGRPARVADTGEQRGEGSGGILRIDFREPDASLEQISWGEFFQTFDRNELAFLYQEETAGGDKSRFFKFVRRD